MFRRRIFSPDAVKHNFAFDFAVNCVYAERFMASEDWLFVVGTRRGRRFQYEDWIDRVNSTLTLSQRQRCSEKEKKLLSVFLQSVLGHSINLLT